MDIGEHCPIDMWSGGAYVCVLSEGIDDHGHPTGQRINGYTQCPQCGIWWPNIEEPNGWSQDFGGQWEVDSWWGAAVCTECNLLLVEQPDGTSECYDLAASEEHDRKYS